MKKSTWTGTWTGSLLALLLSVNPAFAASAREDTSGLVVWIFLGFCALIVVAQLVPVVMMALGLVKGLAKGKGIAASAEAAREPAKH